MKADHNKNHLHSFLTCANNEKIQRLASSDCLAEAKNQLREFEIRSIDRWPSLIEIKTNKNKMNMDMEKKVKRFICPRFPVEDVRRCSPIPHRRTNRLRQRKKKAKRESECNKMQLFRLQLANHDQHWMNSNRSASKIVHQITRLTMKLYFFARKILTDFSYLKFNVDFWYSSLKL